MQLPGGELGKHSLSCREFLEAPLLDDHAAFHDEDAIRVADGGKAVGDDDPRRPQRLEEAGDDCLGATSRALVASSRKRSRGLRAIARAICRRCCWPPDSPPPLSMTSVDIRIGICAISSSSPASRAASHASSSLRPEAPTMFSRIEPGRTRLVCSTTPIC